MRKPKYINWDRCIHIHACRRVCKIVERKTGKPISRGCGENCEAFEEKEDIIDKACGWLEGNVDDYVEADYIEEIDYKPKVRVYSTLIEDFREAMEEAMEE